MSFASTRQYYGHSSVENNMSFITFYLFEALFTLSVISVLTLFYLKKH